MIGTFREWLTEQKDIECYFNELKIIEKEIAQIQAHNNNLIQFNMFLCEAVIEPEKIKINTYNEDELNKEFKKI